MPYYMETHKEQVTDLINACLEIQRTSGMPYFVLSQWALGKPTPKITQKGGVTDEGIAIAAGIRAQCPQVWGFIQSFERDRHQMSPVPLTAQSIPAESSMPVLNLANPITPAPVAAPVTAEVQSGPTPDQLAEAKLILAGMSPSMARYATGLKMPSAFRGVATAENLKAANINVSPTDVAAPDLAKLQNALGSGNLARYAANIRFEDPAAVLPTVKGDIAAVLGVQPGASTAQNFDELASGKGMIRGSELAKQLGFTGMAFSHAVWQGFIKPKPDLETNNTMWWTPASAAAVLKRHKR